MLSSHSRHVIIQLVSRAISFSVCLSSLQGESLPRLSHACCSGEVSIRTQLG